MSDQVRVFDKDAIDSIWLSESPDGLQLTVDVGENELTVTLSASKVRELRLALTRFEKQLAGK